MRAGKKCPQHYNSCSSALLLPDVHTPAPGARRRAAARPPAVAGAADGAGPGALRLRRRAHPARRARVSRRVGSEAAGDPLRVCGAARDLVARRRGARGGSRRGRPRRGAAVDRRRAARRAAARRARRRSCSCSCPIRASTRYGGVRVRAQAETFIALAVTAALALAVQCSATRQRSCGHACWRPGCCSGAAFTLKYNAGLYVLVVLAGAGGDERRDARRHRLDRGAGAARHAARRCSRCSGAAGRSTICTRRPSPTTCTTPARPTRAAGHAALPRHVPDPARAGRRAVVRRRPRLRGPAGRGPAHDERLWVPVVWVAVACVSIAINGSREPAAVLRPGGAGAGARRRAWPATVALTPLPKAARWVDRRWSSPYGVWRAGNDPFPRSSRATSGTTRSTSPAASIGARTWRSIGGAPRHRQVLGARQHRHRRVPGGEDARRTRPSTCSASRRARTSTPIGAARRASSGAGR